MAIKLQDMLKKAESKGYARNNEQNNNEQLIKPWQQNSVIYNKSKQTIHKNVHDTAHKSYTNHTQTIHETSNDTQKHTQRNTNTVHKVITKVYTKKEKEGLDSETIKSIYKRLKGLQKEILVYLYDNCKKNGRLITEVISKEDIATSLNIKYLSIHTTIQRLVDKGYIIRNTPLYGRSGATIYEFPELVYKTISEVEQAKKLYTNIHTGGDSSSSYINNTTTEELPERWINITISPLEHIGFSSTQLKQLSKLDCCNPEIIQDSIYQFAYDLEYNNAQDRLKTTPLNALMGVLRKGQGWNAHNYKPPQMLAMEQILERKKREKAEQEKVLKELYDFEFNEWLSKQDDNQLREVYSKQAGNGAGVFKYGGANSAPTRAMLSKYFEENIWESKKNILFGSYD